MKLLFQTSLLLALCTDKRVLAEFAFRKRQSNDSDKPARTKNTSDGTRGKNYSRSGGMSIHKVESSPKPVKSSTTETETSSDATMPKVSRDSSSQQDSNWQTWDSQASAYKSYDDSDPQQPSRSMKMSKSRGMFTKKSTSMSMRMSMLGITSAEDPSFFESADEGIPTPAPVGPTISPVMTPTNAPTVSNNDTPTPTTSTTTSPTLNPPVIFPTTPSPTVLPTTPPSPVPTILATIPIVPPKTAAPVLESLPTPSAGYKIDLSYSSNVPTTVQQDFQKAADRIQQVIIGDLSDQTSVTITANYQCTDAPDVVDDMWICAQFGALPEFVEGEGGFNSVRFDGDSYLPYVGYITLSDKVPNPPYSVILHEMIHAIGFGNTIWAIKGLLDREDQPCAYSASSAASDEFRSITGCSDGVAAPVDQSSCSHWEETCMLDELMTTTLGVADANNDITYQLSRITVANLQDMGYTVDFDAADPYTADNMDPSCTCRQRRTNDRPPTAPKMSIELREKATAYGQKVLLARHQERQRMLKRSPHFRLSKKEREEFVGDRAIFLLLREGDWRYSMVVTASHEDSD